MQRTRIVQKEVQSANPLHGLVYQATNVARFGNVGHDRKGKLANLACNLLNAILSSAGQRKLCPFSSHGYRACSSTATLLRLTRERSFAILSKRLARSPRAPLFGPDCALASRGGRH